MAFLSLPMALVATFAKDGGHITESGFFFGYNGFVWFVIAQQAFGGLITAMVVKYADNILKGFGTSLAIIISCIVSFYLFDFSLSLQFAIGVMLVLSAVFLYSYKPKEPNTMVHKV